MTKTIAIFLTASILIGCSSTGGIYKEGDSANGEFSAGRTFLTALTVLGAAAAIKKGGGGGGGQESGFAWDYQPGNAQWVCRDKSNGQYSRLENCATLPKVDYWPHN